ncbi:MAG: ATP-binding protein [Clostridia bacterium]|nr:ATP-binding protein [Clostridia bacterium]
MGKITTYGCIGEHLGHSFSKEIHAHIGPYDYAIEELAPKDVPSFLRQRRFEGINVTIPYKETVIPYLDFVDPDANAIGAVNTIVNKEGKLYGYNTDFYGMNALLHRQGISLAGKKVAVLGTGGTSETACHVAKSCGASAVVRVSRSGRKGAVSYDQLYSAHADVQIVINTTPCGMFPDIWQQPIDLERLPSVEGLLDAVYNPLQSVLVMDALSRGINATGGLYMLVSQAVRASELFFSKIYEQDLAEQVYKKVLAGKRNIVLIGMPGSGKSTVGKMLAQKLGFGFADTDELIVAGENIPIPEIFSRYGENYFRDCESEVIRMLAPSSSTVIATGGGAVLRNENREALAHNGLFVFLDRPIEDIVPTADRPLSKNREDLEKRYNERHGLYESIADVVIRGSKSVSQTVEEVEKQMSTTHRLGSEEP